MEIKLLNSKDCDLWDDFVAQESRFGLLQSWNWGEFKEKLGWKAFRIALEDQGVIKAGVQMLIKPLPLGNFSIAYIPRGPVGDWLNREYAPVLLREIHRLAMQHRAIFLKIEPGEINDPHTDQVIRNYGFHPSQIRNQPRATIILNLQQDQEMLLMQMRKKTRQYIRRAEREGITVRAGSYEDLPALYHLVYKTSQREHFTSRLRRYYELEYKIFTQNNQSVLLLAYQQDRLLAARVAYCFGKHAAEFHAGSEDDVRDLHPNYLLVWEAIKWAKARGSQTYDFWGIPDELSESDLDLRDGPPLFNRSDGLWGVYYFKSGFCTNIVSYIGAYDYIYSPTLYRIITSRLFNTDLVDRVSAWLDYYQSR